MTVWAFRAALLNVVGCGFGFIILATVILRMGPIRNHALRWAAGAPIRATILMVVGLLVTGSFRLIWRVCSRRARELRS